MSSPPQHETHFVHRVGWLRAAVLGANDGIVSTASLLVGVAAASTDQNSLLIAGTAALAAGAMSMAAGEYVSVSTQADVERADLATEKQALESFPEEEHAELAAIYVSRGLQVELADEVATQLMAHDALAAHARDELEISADGNAQPMMAALTSAISFSVGAALPLSAAALSPPAWTSASISGTAVLSLAVLGVVSARAGGADPVRATARVVLWGAAAMVVTYAVGSLFGV